MGQFIDRLHHQEDGQAMVEYALIIALVAIVVIGVLLIFGKDISNVFNNAANSVKNP